jgi:hypothetical protein
MERARTLGLTFLALGMIELGWVAFCLFGGALLALTGFADRDMGKFLWVLSGAYGIIAAANVPIALIHLYAGRQLRSGTGLVAAIAAVAACLPSLVFALYCAPFALGALVHGIVVLADAETRAAIDPQPTQG